MRVVFMGSPEFALPALRRLIASEHDVVGVFTQPDRPTGRGRKTAPPPVKTLALGHGLRVFQPASISKPDAVEEMRALRPDVGVIAAYGQILKQPVLDVPPLGILNVHASLLPRWRGAAPIPAAILAGDAETGSTIMRVVRALDAGPMLASARVQISAGDTAGSLMLKVADVGADLLIDVLPKWLAGTIDAVEQDDALATYAPQIEKTDALIHWNRDDANTIVRQVRAYNPWPMAYSYLDGQALRIVEAIARPGAAFDPPGTIVPLLDPVSPPRLANYAPFGVVAAYGLLPVLQVQPSGGRVMAASSYLRGHRDIIGKRLTAEP